MNLSDDDEEAATPAEGKAEALQQLKEECKALDASRKLLEELLSKVQEDAVAKAAAGNRSVSYGGAVFNGPISARKMIGGTHVSGGTASFDLSG